MRKLFTIVFLYLLSNNLYAQHFEAVKDRTGKMLLKGFVTDSILKADTINYKWFIQDGKTYVPKDEIVQAFATNKNAVQFLIFFGTWCADSHYVLPRFFKIKEAAGIANNRITMFGLDRTKKDATHFASALGIEHVPTIIIYRNGKELGRVVEYGATGKFDEELAAILKN